MYITGYHRVNNNNTGVYLLLAEVASIIYSQLYSIPTLINDYIQRHCNPLLFQCMCNALSCGVMELVCYTVFPLTASGIRALLDNVSVGSISAYI